jgi:hypothetical protein
MYIVKTQYNMIKDVLKTETGSKIISIILGLGLAAMFRKVCSKGTCVVIKGPSLKDVEQYHYKIKEDCYKYTPYVVSCENASGEQVSMQ